MTAPGRQLLELPPAQWIDVHRQRWPLERVSFQEAAGRVLAKALRGTALVQRTHVDQRGRTRLELQAIESIDRTALDLRIPKANEDGMPAGKSLDLQAVLLPAAVRADATWVMKPLGAVHGVCPSTPECV